MIVRRDIQNVSYPWNSDAVIVHVHELDDLGNTWGQDYTLSNARLLVRAAGKSTWDDADLAAELAAFHPLG